MDGGFFAYDQNVSDHRPVALKLNTLAIVLGDLNDDNEINEDEDLEDEELDNETVDEVEDEVETEDETEVTAELEDQQ